MLGFRWPQQRPFPPVLKDGGRRHEFDGGLSWPDLYERPGYHGLAHLRGSTLEESIRLGLGESTSIAEILYIFRKIFSSTPSNIWDSCKSSHPLDLSNPNIFPPPSSRAPPPPPQLLRPPLLACAPLHAAAVLSLRRARPPPLRAGAGEEDGLKKKMLI